MAVGIGGFVRLPTERASLGERRLEKIERAAVNRKSNTVPKFEMVDQELASRFAII